MTVIKGETPHAVVAVGMNCSAKRNATATACIADLKVSLSLCGARAATEQRAAKLCG
ncbi:MAG: hypothetical protein AB8B71_01250 [Paracoccaceae bacterium]